MRKMLDKSLRHDSMRGWFAYELHKHMLRDKNIWVITGDLGYKMFDYIKRDFPERVVNAGAAEQAMIDIAVGLAVSGKKPFVYSMTTFLLYRPFEAIHLYLNHDKIPVRLVGSGRGKDYPLDGISHWPLHEGKIMRIFKNIESLWPKTKEEIPKLVSEMVKKNKPWYVNLRR